MEEYRSSFQGTGGDRRVEIVSGKSFTAGNQVYAMTSRPWSPDPAPQVPRGSQAAASSSTSSKPWGFSDPEMKRKKRIAKYKVYTIEGKVKASIRTGFRWIKNKCSEIIHGY